MGIVKNAKKKEIFGRFSHFFLLLIKAGHICAPYTGMPYKDSLFRSLFANEKAILRLYNALYGTDHHEHDAKITINTLDDTLLSLQKNDLSFLVNGKLVVLLEHQSTINQNMPLRLLAPIARIFENGISDKKAPFRSTMIKLPRPDFIVLYNGTVPCPDRKTLRLSDAFEKLAGFDEIKLELEVTVYNINAGRNEEMLNRSVELKGYAYFVSRVRSHEAVLRREGAADSKTVTLLAIRQAMQDCKAKGLLLDFWESLTQEEANMLVSELDMNLALEVREEEGFERGVEMGLEKGKAETAIKMLKKGFDVPEVAELVDMPVEQVEELLWEA